MNRQLLQALHDTFPSGHIIDLFNSLRREVIFQKIQRLINNEDSSRDPLRKLQIGLEQNLCHPLLLPAAIAGSLVGNSLYEKLLTDFLEGNLVNDFSQSWIKVSINLSHDTHQLEQFIEYEYRYCLGLYAFLLDSFKKGGKNTSAHCFHLPLIEQLIERGYEKSGIDEFNKKYGFSPHILRRNAWTIFNMPMASLAGFGSEREAAVLYKYGYDNNSFWHNTTALDEYNFNQIKKAFNDAARSSDQKVITEVAKKLKTSEYFLRRSRRLYWWNPCEIDAHSYEDYASEIIFSMMLEENEEGGA